MATAKRAVCGNNYRFYDCLRRSPVSGTRGHSLRSPPGTGRHRLPGLKVPDTPGASRAAIRLRTH